MQHLTGHFNRKGRALEDMKTISLEYEVSFLHCVFWQPEKSDVLQIRCE